jgi:hypothetical protein
VDINRGVDTTESGTESDTVVLASGVTTDGEVSNGDSEGSEVESINTIDPVEDGSE